MDTPETPDINYPLIRQRLKTCLIQHSRYATAHKKITKIIAENETSGEPACLFVSGPPGVGKTTLFRKIAAEHPPADERVEVKLGRRPPIQVRLQPVVAITMPASPNTLLVLKAILTALGDPFADDGTYEKRLTRTTRYLNLCGVRAIIIDEASRLVDDTGEMTSNHIVELIKSFHSELACSIIFLGLGRLKYLFQQDPQMDDRFGAGLRLEPFKCFKSNEIGRAALDVDGKPVPNGSEWERWRGTLKNVQISSGLVSEARLASEDWAQRLYYATAGVLRRLKYLLAEALSIAEDQKSVDGITLHILEVAFDNVLRKSATPFNPFQEDWPENPLLPVIEDDTMRRPRKGKGRLDKATGGSATEIKTDLGRAIAQKLGV